MKESEFNMNNNYKWSVLENIVTMICTVVMCKYVSIWGLLFLINLSFVQSTTKKNKDKEDK